MLVFWLSDTLIRFFARFATKPCDMKNSVAMTIDDMNTAERDDVLRIVAQLF